MNKASLPFLLIIGLYLGFEAFTASRAAYRLEPLYIFDQLVSAERAMIRCGAADEQTLAQYRGTLRSVADKALAALAEANSATEQTAEEAIQARRLERELAVDALVEERGCSHSEVTTLQKRFSIYARRRLG